MKAGKVYLSRRRVFLSAARRGIRWGRTLRLELIQHTHLLEKRIFFPLQLWNSIKGTVMKI